VYNNEAQMQRIISMAAPCVPVVEAIAYRSSQRQTVISVRPRKSLRCQVFQEMKFLERLDRIVRPIAIPNLTLIIIVGQVMLYIISTRDPLMLERAKLVWDNVLQGEVWRLITFLFVPPPASPIFLFFILYIFYLFGGALEQHWGFVRYNAFLWLGAVLTIAAAGLAPAQGVTGAFLQGTVFLAFATYNPTFELRLFFVLPIQVKWLAYLQGIGYGFALLAGPMSTRLMVLASIGNYLIFFGPAIFGRIRSARRRMEWDARQYKQDSAARHTCTTCGVDSNTDPKMDFRYCSKCEGQHAYCEDHLRDHEHVVEPSVSADT
jgi:hypothetical protein